MSNINELRHGDCLEAYGILDRYELTDAEVRAALMNAFNRIDYLEKQVKKLAGACHV